MKVKVLSAAIATVLIVDVFYQNLQAATATTGVTVTVPTAAVSINLAGSSEQDRLLQSILSGDICTSGSLVIFKDNDGGTTNTTYWGGRWTSYYCTVAVKASTPVSLQSKILAVNKRSAGGSGYGVLPLVNNPTTGKTPFPINFMAETATNCKMQDTTQTIPTYGCTASETSGHIAGTNTALVIPDAGVLDSNPGLYTGVNTVLDFGVPILASDVATLTVANGAALTFGVPVTLDLYKALQAAQGLNTGSCSLGAYGYTGATAACMPSLTRYHMAALISGGAQNWEQFSFNGTNLVTAAESAGVAAPGDMLVHYCQGTAGSGAAANQYAKFLNSPCNANAASPVADNRAAGGVAVSHIYTSADMEACLDDLQNGTSNAVDYVTGGSVNANVKAWGFGAIAADKNAVSSTSTYAHGYRYIKVDGFTPTLQNVVNGSYSNWAQTSWVISKSATIAPTGAKLDAINYIRSESTLGTVLPLANVVQSFGTAGYLGLPTPYGPAANVISNPVNTSNPVTPMAYTAGDNCSVPVPVTQTEIFTFQ
ncbi:hypothetical protein [Methylomonas sp. AM2-LC]|uniref:hypothetical protein n=1 Tax=Methylomonas sp. AM2-LC TaxID=3153301 RepID=UPI0032678B99